MRTDTSVMFMASWASLALLVAIPCLAGDLDADGIVDSADVCNNTPLGTAVDDQGRPLGDLDRDCDTDIDDFALFQQGLTGPLPPPEMVLVPGGAFAMGCHAETGEVCDNEELPVHDVLVAPFLIGRTEVTNRQYCVYLNAAYASGLIDAPDLHAGSVHASGSSGLYCETTTSATSSRITWDGSEFAVVTGKENHPMILVSWFGAVAYANWLSEIQNRTPCYDLSAWTCNFPADGYRLPTEAEWECASRGGAHSPYLSYPWGNTINGSKANYWDSEDPYESGDFPWTTPVTYFDGNQTPAGQDMANAFGLYDAAGNVLEWCHDWHNADYYSVSPYDNPTGPDTGTLRILRGGSWLGTTGSLRCAFRARARPCDPSHSFGFRLAIRGSD